MKQLLVLPLLVLPFSVPAKAVTIDPNPTIPSLRSDAVVTGSYTVNLRVIDYKQDYLPNGAYGTIDADFGNIAEATVHLDLGRAPRMSASSFAIPPSNGQSPYSSSSEATSSVNLYYYFRIVGPSVASVPVLVQAQGQITTSGQNSAATANLLLGDSTGNMVLGRIAAGQPGYHGFASFEVDRYFLLSSNTNYLVTMNSYAWAAGDSYGNSSGIATSFVDPYFAIDPGFSDYHLVFSDGINNTLVSAVPLPAAAPMFGVALLGLASLGYGAKRRRVAAA